MLWMECLLAYRGILFKQVLPGLDPLLDTMRQIAKKRGKSVSQVLQYSAFLLDYFIIIKQYTRIYDHIYYCLISMYRDFDKTSTCM